MRLRGHLTLLVLAAVLPLLSFTAYVVYEDLREQREILERGMRNTARALSLALDGEVRTSLGILETLATLRALDARDYATFHEQATRSIMGREGYYVVLFDRDGQQLANTTRLYATPLPNPLVQSKPPAADERYPLLPLGGAAVVRQVIETGRPVVSDLFVALGSRRPTIGIAIPVLRDGALRYVLEMAVEPEPLVQLLLAQRLPADSIATLLDSKGLVIARTLNGAETRGQRLPLAGQAASAPEGISTGRTVEGVDVLHAFTRSEATGWTVSLAVSQAVVGDFYGRPLALLAGGAALAVILGLLAAAAVGRRIERPIAQLAASAGGLARGEPIGLEVGAVRELKGLQDALAKAGAAARETAIEHERRLLAEESEQRFRVIADSAPVLIWMSGPDKLCTWFNKSWLDFVGRPMEKEIGNGWTENVHAEDFERRRATYAGAFEARAPFSMEYRLRRHDGEYRWLRDDGVPRFERGGAFSGYIGACTDISALRSADRAKDEFLAMLSHELRNPLAALTSAAHVLKVVPPGSGEAGKARGVVERQTRQMARLIGDLLDISRVTLGKLALQRQRFDLAEAVTRIVNSWRAAGRLAGHTVLLSAEPAWIEGDRARIEQIASNLLDNAVKFTPAAGQIELRVRREGAQALLEVADRGMGMSAEECRRVFDLFVQGGASERAGGLGIGLALVKRLAELHDGTVSAASEGVGRGATFTVRFPAIDAPQKAEETAPGTAGARPRSILIVEDNEDARHMLEAALALGGHQVRAAGDGRTGLALAAEARPEVAFIDIGLPDMDGYEVARRLRAATNGGRRIELVAVTGFGQAEDRRRALEAGFDLHLVKPVAPETIKRLIAGLP